MTKKAAGAAVLMFDSRNRDVKRHNVAWKKSVNAANFAAEVTEIVVARVDLSDSDRQMLCAYLDVCRKLSVWGFTDDTPLNDPIVSQRVPALADIVGKFQDWRRANEQSKLGPTIAVLASTTQKLFWQPTRSSTSIANDAGRWVYTWAVDTGSVTEAEIEEIEIRHRVADCTAPPSENLRLAFEAIWRTGDYRRAIKFLHQKEH